jgi:hypothetical protein
MRTSSVPEIRPGDMVQISGNGEHAGRTGTAVRLGSGGMWFVKTNGGRQLGLWLDASDLVAKTDDDGVDVSDRRGGFGDVQHVTA